MTIEGLENRKSFGVGERDRGYAGNSSVNRPPRDPGFGRIARRCPVIDVSSLYTQLPKHNDLRVAWSNTEELGTSPLDTARLTSRSFGVRSVAVLFRRFTIFTGISEDDNADHPQLLRPLDLEPTEDEAITSNGDLPGKADVGLEQVLKILIRAVVDVDHGCGDVAGGRITVEDGDSVGQTCARILVEDVLFKSGFKRNLPVVRAAVVFLVILIQEGQAMVDWVVDVYLIVDDV